MSCSISALGLLIASLASLFNDLARVYLDHAGQAAELQQVALVDEYLTHAEAIVTIAGWLVDLGQIFIALSAISLAVVVFLGAPRPHRLPIADRGYEDADGREVLPDRWNESVQTREKGISRSLWMFSVLAAPAATVLAAIITKGV